MASPVDPNSVLMTGENSFIRLSLDGGTTLSTRVSHWRVLWCPRGPAMRSSCNRRSRAAPCRSTATTWR